jgi:hypothetical protein
VFRSKYWVTRSDNIRDGYIQIYDVFGKFLYYFELPEVAMSNAMILKVVDWGAGLAFLISQYNADESRSLAIWVVNDINDPVCMEFANTRMLIVLPQHDIFQQLAKISMRIKK